MLEHVTVEGAREHNLQGVSLQVPRNALTVFTGVSGSGKSSLAYDTLYKEGQRRFVQSLSAYARQFLGQMERPAVDHVEGLSPAVAIDQKTRGRNPRSTVGTITEIYDHFRLLYARLGTPHCPACGRTISSQSAESIARGVLAAHPGARCLVLAPVVDERKGEYRKELAELAAQGFVRVRIDGELRRTEEPVRLARYEKHTIEVVYDRLVLEPQCESRLVEAVEHCLELSGGLVRFLVDEVELPTCSRLRACPDCRVSIPELEPRSFSFNARGACARCRGLGQVGCFDEALIVPDPGRTLADGALAPLAENVVLRGGRWRRDELRALAKLAGAPLDLPWSKLTAGQRKVLLHGAQQGQRRRRGVVGLLEQAAGGQMFSSTRRRIEQFMRLDRCPDCAGTRLSAEARAVRFRERSIDELHALTVGAARAWFEGLELTDAEQPIGRQLVAEIGSRLEFLDAVGLGYLALERSAATLAGGESQRIRLASQLGARLSGVLYILDEPSIGLHARDNQRLIGTLHKLRDQGNTVYVIEHDEETIRAADHVVDLGPGAGREGGRLVAQGTPEEVARQAGSLTGGYLSGRCSIPLPASRRARGPAAITVHGATQHNLQDVTVEFPLGLFIAVTGVSGSGKSSLVEEVLHRGLAAALHGAHKLQTGAHRGISGIEEIDKVIEIDQDPIGRTPRSNPATYTKAFDLVRELFAQTPLARARGYARGRFSFNKPGGRCETCCGAGCREIEMQFLANVLVPCEECGGRRYNPETLEVQFKQRSIRDVLELSISEALELFAHQPKIARILQTLADVGMGYCRVGQPSTTLSGGEAQRIKLSRELARPATGRTLYLLDEPTTGLHWADVARLIDCLHALVDRGNTVLVIEHNLELIKVADWCIDLGPEGGAAGGRVVYQGPYEGFVAHPESHTARALRQHLAPPAPPRNRRRSRPASAENGRSIVIRGAHQNNLKRIDVEIPHDRLTVVTGVSGSGKSSLVFDILFAEGQRRFVESLSTYARRFLGRMGRAAVDGVAGLAPAIAIDQKRATRNPRSTVATATEIYDYLRLLYARLGTEHCLHCDRPLAATSAARAARDTARRWDGRPVSVLAPLWLPGNSRRLLLQRRDDLRELAARLFADGYARLDLDGEVLRLDDPLPRRLPNAPLHLVLDRVTAGEPRRARLAEAFEAAYRIAGGWAAVRAEGEAPVFPYSARFGCAACGTRVGAELHPRMFSFNSWEGACRNCNGLGHWRGIICPECDGERLQPRQRKVRVGELSITGFCALRIDRALAFLREQVRFRGKQARIAEQILAELTGRLQFLVDVGLSYLTLDRRASTLSGGESQRIRLATQIGSRLVGVLYCLDEPTVGLHPRDTGQLLDALERLRALGNTVVLVEHDLQTIRRADHCIDLGPGAGEEGGQVVAAGPPRLLACNEASLTGRYLAGTARIPRPAARRPGREGLTIEGASLHNLAAIDVELPLGCLVAVSGVSGSGKSSLVIDTLCPVLARALSAGRLPRGPYSALHGWRAIDRLQVIDQEPIGTTPRSTPATYLGIMDPLRDLFAATRGARAKGFDKSRFSYNVHEGQCYTCQGKGALLIEMHFLSDVWIRCSECNGQRYNAETLQVRWQGLTIADVLALHAGEAASIFAAHPRIAHPLELLDRVGLGYLRLGGGVDQLSGGEAQRIKLAAELAAPAGRAGHTLYVMDEPTTGLHLEDVRRLLAVLQELVEAGHSVLVVEHHPDVLAAADWIVDLGPEAGEDGGRVVAAGTPEEVAACAASHTGRVLAELLPSSRS